MDANNTIVYFYFKQDYGYRGLEGTFSGSLLLTELQDYVASCKVNQDEIVFAELHELHPDWDTQIKYSFWEAVCVEPNLIKNLQENQLVSTVDEIGYAAFSLESISAAKKQVQQDFIQNEFDD
jgi:hypothetical protein